MSSADFHSVKTNFRSCVASIILTNADALILMRHFKFIFEICAVYFALFLMLHHSSRWLLKSKHRNVKQLALAGMYTMLRWGACRTGRQDTSIGRDGDRNMTV